MKLWSFLRENTRRIIFPNRVEVIRRYGASKQKVTAGHGALTDSTREKRDPGFCGTQPLESSAASIIKDHGTADEANVLLESLAIRLQRDIRFDLPFEMTIVIPRAEISKKYQDGNLAEVNVVYSGITIAHSPRYPLRRSDKT